jgi:hypothetical protein
MTGWAVVEACATVGFFGSDDARANDGRDSFVGGAEGLAWGMDDVEDEA